MAKIGPYPRNFENYDFQFQFRPQSRLRISSERPLERLHDKAVMQNIVERYAPPLHLSDHHLMTLLRLRSCYYNWSLTQLQVIWQIPSTFNFRRLNVRQRIFGKRIHVLAVTG
jgi:hypothetical protein